MVDKKCIRTDPDKIQKVLDWMISEYVTHVCSYIGVTSYYRRFIHNYAAIASPLYDPTKKDIEFL